MHIHTYPDANRRGSGYNCGALLTNVRRDARGHRIVISLTDHNTINKEAYKELAELGADDVTPILGVELHVRSNGKRPYHAHAYFDSSVTDDAFIDGNLVGNAFEGFVHRFPRRKEQLPKQLLKSG